MITYDKVETRANRHKRKVTLRLPILRQVRFVISQKAGKDGIYAAPTIAMEPRTFTMQDNDEINEFRVALTRAHEIYAQMNNHTGKKSRALFIKAGTK